MGVGYARVRRPDPRLASSIWSALGDAASIVNVGAGTGSYEPRDRPVIAIEPSAVMIAQRRADAPPVIAANAEALPLERDAVDAALAVLTLQHWADLEGGLKEMQRVARRRIVLLTVDPDVVGQFWLVRDYLPESHAVHASGFPTMSWLLQELPRARSLVVPVPNDCSDGFMLAYWARPEAYLDETIRMASSVWHQLPGGVVERGLSRLRHDLARGDWERRYGHFRRRDSLDVGLRLVCAELGPDPA